MSNNALSSIEQAFTPLQIGPLLLKNRFIKSATNEGMSPQGVPSRQLVEFHAAMAAGGAALTTVAYCAVSADGCTLPSQIRLDRATLPHLRVLTDAVHAAGGAVSAQITHGGCFTFTKVEGKRRPLSASGGFNKIGLMSGQFFKRAMGSTDMQRIAEDFAEGARLAREAGFDAVEIHMGHGYLLSQFISPLYNRRRDEYGGSLANRMRFPRQVLRQVLDAVGDDLAVICKFSMTDGVRAGNRPEDGVEIARHLAEEGAHMLVLSAGMNAESITTMFGSSFPPENRAVVTNPIMKAAMYLQQLAEKPRDFSELYLLKYARQVRSAVNIPLAYLGGLTSADGVNTLISEGFEAMALGRVLIHDPTWVNQLRDGSMTRSGCTACNRCVAMMYTEGGTSCVLGKPGDPLLNSMPAAG
ncbi:NADH:flavin oxidoreductase [Halopseudomonas phragmitis]|uniref:Flavin oxidoreductase n=1 Tax=Halopseudomonas phragmitis TaxID=1931241 RepID=A0A1V0B9D4_9GAMM|nr:NADH:flavin oxidoreductase [Halopseudomonas phragmitis]AQZ96500.1 flavin oxidoreductase [Halopseudomonas phragmitis]